MRYLATLLVFLSLNVWGIEVKVPPLSSPVVDTAGLFSTNQREDLAGLAYEIYANKGPQITVLTVETLDGFAIEDFSMAVAEKWQLGTKDQGNGLLVLIAKQERKVRIEVGDGIEGEVTDFETANYTRQIFPAYFKRGEFYQAIRIFMEDMATKFNIKLEDGNKIVRRAPVRHQNNLLGMIFVPFLIFSIFLNLVLRKNAGLRGAISGFGGAGIAWLILPGLGLGMILVVFIVAFLFGLMGISNLFSGMSSDGYYGGGGYRGGGGWGGGSSGGGWSGGGGGFSGGGSSGDW